MKASKERRRLQLSYDAAEYIHGRRQSHSTQACQERELALLESVRGLEDSCVSRTSEELMVREVNEVRAWEPSLGYTGLVSRVKILERLPLQQRVNGETIVTVESTGAERIIRKIEFEVKRE